MPQGAMGIPRLLDFDLVLGIHTTEMSVFGGGAGRWWGWGWMNSTTIQSRCSWIECYWNMHIHCILFASNGPPIPSKIHIDQYQKLFVCLLDLIIYVPSTIFQLWVDGSSCNVLAQGHNAVTPVRIEPAAPLFRVKHSRYHWATALPYN